MSKTRIALIALLFFVSGLTSLIYETIWIRVLSLGVGSTSTSMSLVLSIFFLGLSIGSWLAGKWAQQIKKPILFYGAIEGFIGIYSALLIYALFNFHKVLDAFPVTASFSPVGLSLKFTLVFLFLILPTTLMGMSLPLLMRIFVHSPENLGRTISFLYGANTLGAVVGAFITGFWLIPEFGVIFSNHGAAILNLGIFATAILLQRNSDLLPLEETQLQGDKPKLTGWISLTAFVMGFSSLSAEVAWNKYLGIYLGSNIYGLSLVLALFLFGIAAGALILSIFIEKIKNLSKFYLTLLIACVLSLILTSYLLDFAPIMAQTLHGLAPQVSLLVIKSGLVVVLMLLPSTLMGAILPISIRLQTANSRQAPAVTGRLYAINTIGAILGSSLAGLYLIPQFGSGNTILIAVVVLLLTTLYAYFRIEKLKRTLWIPIGFVMAVVAIATLPALKFDNILRYGYSSHIRSPDVPDEEFVFIKEGRSGIISLSHDPQDGETYRDFLRLKTNGLNESVFDLKDLWILPKYEALLGVLPLALARNPEKAFIVGYGGGYTVDFLTSTDLDLVKVIELEQGIIDASNYVYKNGNPILQRKNLDLQIEDARFALARGIGAPYDLILSQPSHSWLAGAANLFTKDFFDIVFGRLSDWGVYSQWLNLYNMNPEVLKSILRTFYTVFPHGAVFTGAGDQELIMIGTKAPLRFSIEKLNAIAHNEKIRKQLALVPMNDAYDLLSLFVLNRDDVMNLTEGAIINTDQNAYAETTQSRLFYTPAIQDPNQFLVAKFTANYENVVGNRNLTPRFYDLMMSTLESQPGQFRKIHRLLEKFGKENGIANDLSYAQHALKAERYATALGTLETIVKGNPKDASAFNLLIGGLISTKKIDQAKEVWKIHPKVRNKTSACYELEINPTEKLAAKIQKRWDEMANLCGPFLWKSMGLYLEGSGRFDEAIVYLEPYYIQNTGDFNVYEALTNSYVQSGDKVNGDKFTEALARVRDQESNRLFILGEFYRTEGFSADADLLFKIRDQL